MLEPLWTGGIRDIDEMANAGFKALARRLCIGHAYSIPVRWNCEAEVFGCRVRPGELIHADKHGFLVVPKEDELLLLAAAKFMDDNECEHVIPASRGSAGKGLMLGFRGKKNKYMSKGTKMNPHIWAGYADTTLFNAVKPKVSQNREQIKCNLLSILSHL